MGHWAWGMGDKENNFSLLYKQGLIASLLLTQHRLNAPLPLTPIPMPNAQCPNLISSFLVYNIS
ncbi:hypothetical protein H6H03_19430 [Nostoc paludosum FACHB-159]|uniref:Uncharacterized protein n=1 Tax=Nostoc paludosum FACHB-159 TaxID=2692908 RepID=A0ABR8KB74_9NOSO|nr:hypothetical protein [Nostoc paludosum FACHB-159]